MSVATETIKLLEKRVVTEARNTAKVYATTAGFGKPLAQALRRLNNAVERLESKYARASG